MKLSDLFAKREKQKLIDPKHVGFVIVLEEKTTDNFKKNLAGIHDILDLALQENVPVISLYFPGLYRNTEQQDNIIRFMKDLSESEFIQKNQVRLSFIGKWYDLSGDHVDTIKEIMDSTKHFDRFFLNLCIKYDGQQEIIDAVRIIRKKTSENDVDGLTKDMIKDNLYTSYFLPPEVIIITGKKHKTYGFLLWDSVDSNIYFTNRFFESFSKSQAREGIERYRSIK